MGLAKTKDGWRRFHNHPYGGTPAFDFRSEAADAALLAETCASLQTSPESPYVMTATCQRPTGDG